jgi:hypothetical protein
LKRSESGGGDETEVSKAVAIIIWKREGVSISTVCQLLTEDGVLITNTYTNLRLFRWLSSSEARDGCWKASWYAS